MNKHWPKRKSKYNGKKRQPSKPVFFFREEHPIVKEKGCKMNKFWELVKSSVIVQGTVTLVLVATTCYLYATGKAVPESLLSLDGLVIGFFFGSKVQSIAERKGG